MADLLRKKEYAQMGVRIYNTYDNAEMGTLEALLVGT
jgi:hypothetical protein